MKQFENLQATQIYCPKCRVATPVREKLLLVLPDGDLHEYLCSRCGTSLGKRKTSGERTKFIPIQPGGRPNYM